MSSIGLAGIVPEMGGGGALLLDGSQVLGVSSAGLLSGRFPSVPEVSALAILDTANRILGPQYLNKSVVYTGVAGTFNIELPALSQAAVGSTLSIVNSSGATLTVKVKAGDVMGGITGSTPGHLTASGIVLKPYTSVVFVKTGEWYAVSGTATEYTGAGQLYGGFSSLMGANGWQRLPSGLIMQWGESGSASPATITFPTPFPNAVFNISATLGLNTGETPANLVGVETPTKTKTSFVLRHNNAGARTVYWTAYGN